jgi:hypothetical protein
MFVSELLHAIFPEEALARIVSLDDSRGWLSLADGHQSDIFRAASGAGSRARHALVNSGEIASDCHAEE